MERLFATFIISFFFLFARLNTVKAIAYSSICDTFIVELPLWQPVGTGLNNDVHCIVEANGLLYVGGKFINAGGNPQADHIAVWDGVQWKALGAGLNQTVEQILVHDGKVYAAGAFTNAGGQADADYFAVWDGTTWSKVGEGGFDGRVMDIALDSMTNDIYVGGFFKEVAGNFTFRYLVKWDGVAWAGVGSGVDNEVYGVEYTNDYIYIGGKFQTPYGFIARWNRTNWEPIPITLLYITPPLYVFSVEAAPNGYVYFGYNLVESGWAEFDGTTSESLNTYCHRTAFESMEHGYFIGATTISINSCAPSPSGDVNLAFLFRPFDNTLPFTQLLSGSYALLGDIRTIHYGKSGNLYAGGSFINFNNQLQCDHIACVRKVSTKSDEPQTWVRNVQVYPNPFVDQLTVEIGGQPAPEAQFVLYNQLGQLVWSERFNSSQTMITNQSLPVGTYFWSVEHLGVVIGRGVVSKIE
jgi:hypothetical protein